MKRFTLTAFVVFISACAGGPTPISGISVETPQGEKVGCTINQEACVEICEYDRDGYKFKVNRKLEPKSCL